MISVLYIDDEEDLLTLGKLYLERHGDFTVDTCASSGKAIDKIQKGAYDAILSDYQMPGMNGLALLKQVRALFGDIPFILFTGRGREEVVIEAIENGVDFYLQKGGDPKPQFAELAHKIKKSVEQNQILKSLAKNEERMRYALDGANEGLWDNNLLTGKLYVSPRMCEMLGYTLEQIQVFSGRAWETIVHPDDVSPTREAFQKYLNGESPLFQIEQRVQMHSGEWKWVLTRGKAVTWDENQNPIRFVGTYTDITSQKKVEEELIRKNEEIHSAYEELSATEEELRLHNTKLIEQEQDLRDSRQQLLDIIDFLPDATYVVDMKGVVVAWNRAMEEMTGAPKDAIIGEGDFVYTIPFYGIRRKNLLDLLDLDDEEIKAKYQYVQRKGKTICAEFFSPNIYLGKGAYLWAIVAPLYDTHGNRTGAIGSIRDITELRKCIEELRRNVHKTGVEEDSD